jgi:hypothetical protein
MPGENNESGCIPASNIPQTEAMLEVKYAAYTELSEFPSHGRCDITTSSSEHDAATPFITAGDSTAGSECSATNLHSAS